MSKRKPGYAGHLCWTPDDSGFYVEVYDCKTGEEVHVTGIYRCADHARHAARRWMRKQARKPIGPRAWATCNPLF